jgi:excisionase family DNA binding protein
MGGSTEPHTAYCQTPEATALPLVAPALVRAHLPALVRGADRAAGAAVLGLRAHDEGNRRMSEPILVCINDAMALARVSRRTIYNWLESGRLEYVRTAGGSVRIVVASLFREGNVSILAEPGTDAA